MNNKTIERFDITIKLRGDNVYDLYINNEWIASRGSYESILNDAKKVIEYELVNKEEEAWAKNHGTKANQKILSE